MSRRRNWKAMCLKWALVDPFYREKCIGKWSLKKRERSRAVVPCNNDSKAKLWDVFAELRRRHDARSPIRSRRTDVVRGSSFLYFAISNKNTLGVLPSDGQLQTNRWAINLSSSLHYPSSFGKAKRARNSRLAALIEGEALLILESTKRAENRLMPRHCCQRQLS